MIIKTSQDKDIKSFLKNLYIPAPDSHKGQNGKVLIVGGSGLFHSASIWAAELSSHFSDMVFYASTKQNNEIIQELKTKFTNGIVIRREDLENYIQEADAILVGPGMMRSEVRETLNVKRETLKDILEIKEEGALTYYLTKYLIDNHPNKKYVFDAGALQMMDKEWLNNLQVPPILTPHQLEFERLFGKNLTKMSVTEKSKEVLSTANKYKSVVLLKAITDIVSDGKKSAEITGGNQGLTKGGTGDVLAALTLVLYAKNEAFASAVAASYLLKKTADNLSLSRGYWYNIDEIIEEIPSTFLRSMSL